MTREEYKTLKRRADEKRERKKREQDMTATLKKHRQALAMEHDPERRKFLCEQQRMYYITHAEQPRVRQLDPMNYKRIYTNGGGTWACLECNATREDGVQLHIHHKDQNRHNNEFSNLACLCSKCHKDLHARWRNQTIPYLIKYHINWRGHIYGRSEPL